MTNQGTTRYRAGESIPRSGIYRVVHDGHRSAHENSLIEGESFPLCKHCGDQVQFEFLQGRSSKRDRKTDPRRS